MALNQRDATRSGEASCSYFNENQNEILTLSTKPAAYALDTLEGLETLRCDGAQRFTPLYEILAACTRAGDRLFMAAIGTGARPTSTDAALLVQLLQVAQDR